MIRPTIACWDHASFALTESKLATCIRPELWELSVTSQLALTGKNLAATR